MTPIEALELTLSKVSQIKDVEYEVIPYEDEEDLELELDEPPVLPKERWVTIIFNVTNKTQALKIHELANYLGLAGIRFDAGGFIDYREWNLNWSFIYEPGNTSEDWKAAREEVEVEIEFERLSKLN